MKLVVWIDASGRVARNTISCEMLDGNVHRIKNQRRTNEKWSAEHTLVCWPTDTELNTQYVNARAHYQDFFSENFNPLSIITHDFQRNFFLFFYWRQYFYRVTKIFQSYEVERKKPKVKLEIDGGKCWLIVVCLVCNITE